MPDLSELGTAVVNVPVVDGGGATAPVTPVEGSTVAIRHLSAKITPFRVLLVVLVVAALVLAWVLTRPSGPSYRTATVTHGTAVATLAEVGTITPLQQSEPSFVVAGKVGTVQVTVGQHVIAGQLLATLDSTSLQSAVVTAQASLASARATLASDEVTQAAAPTR